MPTRKNFEAAIIVSLILAAIIGVGLYLLGPKIFTNSISLQLGTGVYNSSYSTNSTDRTNGYVNSKLTSSDQAWILAYDNEGYWPLDTKNAVSGTDFVWLNQKKTVVYIIKSNELNSKLSKPNRPAMYIVGLPAGAVNEKMIRSSSIAVFDNPSIGG